MTIVQIAHIAHEANRAYCATLGDFSQPAWCDAPDWQRQSAINGVKFHLDALEQGDKPSPEASHASWLREKIADGWTVGPVKDEALKQHPCCVPYERLPMAQKLKDHLFGGVVEALSHGRCA
jgi:hypothetical protein